MEPGASLADGAFLTFDMRLQSTVAAGVLLLVHVHAHARPAAVSADPAPNQRREYFKLILKSPEAIPDWLAGRIMRGETYHPTLGWMHVPVTWVGWSY